MIRWFPVRARKLLGRRLVCGDIVIERANLLPFFDATGDASHVLIVDDNSPELQVLTLASLGGISIPVWGTVQVDGDLDPLNEDRLHALHQQWHYDPWWLLTDQRFALEPAVPILKSTNCADEFSRTPHDVLFDRCLSTIDYLTYLSKSDGVECRRFKDGDLPEREIACEDHEAKIVRYSWKLAPFWMKAI